MIFIALAAFGGGLLSAIMGWLDSGEPFNLKKFGKSVIVSVLAGIGVAIFSQNAEPSMKNILEAVIVGAGSDVLANRGLGAYRSLTKPDA